MTECILTVSSKRNSAHAPIRVQIRTLEVQARIVERGLSKNLDGVIRLGQVSAGKDTQECTLSGSVCADCGMTRRFKEAG